MRTNSRKVVVVTGASAGVGRAVVRAFAKRGHNVGLIARGRDGLEAAKSEVEAEGGRAICCEVDVADAAAVEQAAAEIERSLGPIDIWVNDAMTSVFSPFLKMTPEEFRRVTEVTYLGFVYGTLSALRRMVPRTAASSSKLDQLWPIAAFPSSRPTVVPSMQSRVLRKPFVAS